MALFPGALFDQAFKVPAPAVPSSMRSSPSALAYDPSFYFGNLRFSFPDFMLSCKLKQFWFCFTQPCLDLGGQKHLSCQLNPKGWCIYCVLWFSDNTFLWYPTQWSRAQLLEWDRSGFVSAVENHPSYITSLRTFLHLLYVHNDTLMEFS